MEKNKKQRSRVQSILGFNCPRCRQGILFKEPLGLKNALVMNERCDKCNLNFEPEPGYYYGAMFISYIIMGWFCLGVVGFCILVLKWSVGASFALLGLILIVGFMWNLRFCRSLYIHLMTKYDPDSISKYKKGKAESASAALN